MGFRLEGLGVFGFGAQGFEFRGFGFRGLGLMSLEVGVLGFSVCSSACRVSGFGLWGSSAFRMV